MVVMTSARCTNSMAGGVIPAVNSSPPPGVAGWSGSHGRAIAERKSCVGFGLFTVARFRPTGEDKPAATTHVRNSKTENNCGRPAAVAFCRSRSPHDAVFVSSCWEFAARGVPEPAKRLQIPGYELARSLFQESTSSNIVAQLLGYGCYLQSKIRERIALALDHR